MLCPADMNQTAWGSREENEEEKIREVSFTLSLTHPMGPKHSQVVETQVSNLMQSGHSGHFDLIPELVHCVHFAHTATLKGSLANPWFLISDHASRKSAWSAIHN